MTCTNCRSIRRIAGSSFMACRSEEHTSELQSHSDLVCRLLLEKKKKIPTLGPATKKLQETVSSPIGMRLVCDDRRLNTHADRIDTDERHARPMGDNENAPQRRR